MDIRGKVALVTGGAFGIGKELVAALLQKGAREAVIPDFSDGAIIMTSWKPNPGDVGTLLASSHLLEPTTSVLADILWKDVQGEQPKPDVKSSMCWMVVYYFIIFHGQDYENGVVILDVNDSNGRRTQEELENRFGKGKVIYRKCDVSSKAQMRAAFQFTIDTYGQLNIVCNNAGFWDEFNWEKMFLVNINGVVNGTQAAVEFMKGEADGGGVIVNIASVAALSLVPLSPLYATSKCAVLGYSRNIAQFDLNVLRKKLRVNILCPSAVRSTNLIPSAKGSPGEERFLDEYLASLPTTTPASVAKAFLKVIEEPHNGASFFIPSYRRQDKEVNPVLVEDETDRFRRQMGYHKFMHDVIRSKL